MSKAKTKQGATDPNTLPVACTPEQTVGQAVARTALRPSINGASVIKAYQGNLLGKDVDLAELVTGLSDSCKQVNGGDLSTLEAMLVSQATALQTIFTSLARRAQSQEYQKNLEAFLGLALKAQAQSRATISALVDLKYPRQATFVKQANIANGPQQVNNGTPGHNAQAHAHAEQNTGRKNELLEHQHGNYLDTGAQGTAGGADPHLAAVEAGQRAAHA
jgi:hypothetical protein